jgi:hypothetical protein
MKRTLPFVTSSLCAGLSSSEDDSDDSSVDLPFFFTFAPFSRWTYTRTYIYEKRDVYGGGKTDARRIHTRARISFEEIGALCFALGTGFSTTFLPPLDLTSGLAGLTDFFSAFLSDFAIVVEDRGQSLKNEKQ